MGARGRKENYFLTGQREEDTPYAQGGRLVILFLKRRARERRNGEKEGGEVRSDEDGEALREVETRSSQWGENLPMVVVFLVAVGTPASLALRVSSTFRTTWKDLGWGEPRKGLISMATLTGVRQMWQGQRQGAGGQEEQERESPQRIQGLWEGLGLSHRAGCPG